MLQFVKRGSRVLKSDSRPNRIRQFNSYHLKHSHIIRPLLPTHPPTLTPHAQHTHKHTPDPFYVTTRKQNRAALPKEHTFPNPSHSECYNDTMRSTNQEQNIKKGRMKRRGKISGRSISSPIYQQTSSVFLGSLADRSAHYTCSLHQKALQGEYFPAMGYTDALAGC